MSKSRKFGWVADTPDARDYSYKIARPEVIALPASVDLRSQFPAVYDQGSLGSCTAQSVAALLQYHRKAIKPSRLFLYYNTRVLEGTVRSDSGAQIRNAIKAAAKTGGPRETLWPYTVSAFARKPVAAAYAAGTGNRALVYERVPRTLDSLKACLAEGDPFAFGFSVYENFMSQEVAKTGTLTLPDLHSQFYGGHAVVAAGYDESLFLIRNSWGSTWGQRGYFTMPYEYLLNPDLSDDFWVIRAVG